MIPRTQTEVTYTFVWPHSVLNRCDLQLHMTSSYCCRHNKWGWLWWVLDQSVPSWGHKGSSEFAVSSASDDYLRNLQSVYVSLCGLPTRTLAVCVWLCGPLPCTLAVYVWLCGLPLCTLVVYLSLCDVLQEFGWYWHREGIPSYSMDIKPHRHGLVTETRGTSLWRQVTVTGWPL